MLRVAQQGVIVEPLAIGTTPATVFHPATGQRGPAVVIAHGFSGSQQLMQSFAIAFARNGYVAVTFDFEGHGRNPTALGGSITDTNGATRRLVEETRRVAEVARKLGDGRLAVLGHSMASDIVVRFAKETPDVAATIAVSMFSPAVRATTPRNLLVIVGDWEGMLKTEALRVVGLTAAPAEAQAGKTFGSFADGTARRASFSPHVEHASVLFSSVSIGEAVLWLDQSFGIERAAPAAISARGPWITLLFAGLIGLAYPLARTLPRAAERSLGAGLGWRRIWLPLLVPMIVTPLILQVVPTRFLPVLVGDYLAAHFATYGVITAMLLWWMAGREKGTASPVLVHTKAMTAAALLAIAYGFAAIVWPLDSFVTSFLPGPQRLVLVAAMLAGTLPYFLADEWMTRGEGAARGAYVASKLAFLASLAIAVSLDFDRLFFLVIIVPVIVLFFIAYGLFSRWIYQRTEHPLVGGLANAVAFAWALGVTFPLLAG